MAKRHKDKNPLSAEQLAVRKLDEKRNQQADEVMLNLNIKKGQHLGISIWKHIRNYVERGKNVAEITYIMERDPKVGQSRTQEIRQLAAKERHKASMVDAKEFEVARTERLSSKPPLQNVKPRQLKNKTKPSLKHSIPKVDPWAVARDASRSSTPQKALTFGAVLLQNPSVKPKVNGETLSVNPLKGVNTPAASMRLYDLPLAKPKVASGKLEGIDKVMKMIPASAQREFAMFVHKYQVSNQTAEQLAANFLATIIAPVENFTAMAAEEIGNTIESGVIESDVVSPKAVESAAPVFLHLRDGHELKGGSIERLIRQRDAAVQAEFRAMVRQNFGDRCAVSGKHLGGVLEAAHIEGADLGCYNVGNGILLSPTLHKLFDRHMMGINPETLSVHFRKGIEFEEYEGRVIVPLIYNLDKVRLAARWCEYLKASK